MLKKLFILFCFYFFFFYGVQKDEIDSQAILDFAIMINLDRSLEKYKETYQLMQKAGFTNILRFSAVDGYFTDEEFSLHRSNRLSLNANSLNSYACNP